MSRAALKLRLAGTVLAGAMLWPAAGAVRGQGPVTNSHVDQNVLPTGCVACHRGHGTSGSPMLPATQAEVCLACHDNWARRGEQVRQGHVAPSGNPVLLGSTLRKLSVHPLDGNVFSERAGMTCTSCHSPHRSMAPRMGGQGQRLPSPKNPNRLEFELCLSCHSKVGNRAFQGRSDIGLLTRLHNPSYHPLEGPSLGISPSLAPELRGREINCTDCHGNDDLSGPRGPHGSDEPFLLRYDSTTTCYVCHRLELVLSETSPFPLHSLHVEEGRASCSICHNPHGSTRYRALIRFGDGSGVVGPNANGVLAFESLTPGSGTCALSCHGFDHEPKGYGLGPVPDPLTPSRLLVAPPRPAARPKSHPDGWRGLPQGVWPPPPEGPYP